MTRSSTAVVSTAQFGKWPALAAMALGLAIVFAAGFSHSSALHNATHDTRHAFGLPCH